MGNLKTKKVSNKIIRVVQRMYRNAVNCVITNNMRSDKFVTREGLLQGSTVFVDEIIMKCNQR